MPSRPPPLRSNVPEVRAKLTVGVDYHGTLCRYTRDNHWETGAISPEGPTPGAIEWLLAAADRFIVAVTCARAAENPGLVGEVADWLVRHGVPRPYVTTAKPSPLCAAPRVWVCQYKPPCWMWIDDRAFLFRGVFPSPAEIDAFRPWNR